MNPRRIHTCRCGAWVTMEFSADANVSVFCGACVRGRQRDAHIDLEYGTYLATALRTDLMDAFEREIFGGGKGLVLA